MDRALTFLSQFDETSRNWLLDNGQEQQFLASQIICQAGDPLSHINIILEGVVSVYRIHADETKELIVRMGSDEIIGEMEWLSGDPASATVEAEEPTLLLTWSCSQLKDKVASDDKFASVFYQALAKIGIDRLRSALRLQKPINSIRETPSNTHIPELNERLSEFKSLISKIDKISIKNLGNIPEHEALQVENSLNDLIIHTDNILGEKSQLCSVTKDSVGAILQQEFLPYLSMTGTADRFYSKPRGYAGDYLTIAKMYDNNPSGSGRIGALIDSCFLNRPPSKAVRNRRHLLHRIINQELSKNPGITTRITSLACGPAQELFDIYSEIENKDSLQSNLIDIDLQALAFVADKRDRMKLTRSMQVFNSNLVYLAAGRQKLPVPPQNLVYSIGLIDYFNDNFVVNLINFAYDLLAPGGKVVLGNFHPRNRDKAFMDYILEWKLIHRDEEDMHRLFRESKFAKAADEIHYEEERINLFAECNKPH